MSIIQKLLTPEERDETMYAMEDEPNDGHGECYSRSQQEADQANADYYDQVAREMALEKPFQDDANGHSSSYALFSKAMLFEAKRARGDAKFEPFHSLHEGYAVLLEEVHELQAYVFAKAYYRDPQAILQECVQIAAMALCIAHECLPDGSIVTYVNEDGELLENIF